MRILYRMNQFWQGLSAVPAPIDMKLARQVLSEDLMSLFLRMQPSEQMHSLSILRKLKEKGENNEALLVAALLHDAGKSRYPLKHWERIFIVLAKRAFPRLAKKWGKGEANGWKRALVVAEKHPAWGAELANASGASPLAVSLILRHQQKDGIRGAVSENLLLEDQLLKSLQEMDDNS